MDVPLTPWVGYGLFVGVSLGLLFLAGRLLASALEGPAEGGFAYFAVFWPLPTYMMLMEGQCMCC